MDNTIRGAVSFLKGAITDQDISGDITLLLKSADPLFDTFATMMLSDEERTVTDAKLGEMDKKFSELERNMLQRVKEPQFANLLRSIRALSSEVLIKRAEWYSK